MLVLALVDCNWPDLGKPVFFIFPQETCIKTLYRLGHRVFILRIFSLCFLEGVDFFFSHIRPVFGNLVQYINHFHCCIKVIAAVQNDREYSSFYQSCFVVGSVGTPSAVNVHAWTHAHNRRLWHRQFL